MPSVTIDLSSSMSVFLDKRGILNRANEVFCSRRRYLYLYLEALIGPVTTAAIFLCIIILVYVSLYEFIFMQFTMGTTYIFMDFFIKLYSRRIDAPKLLNPLIHGVTYGLYLQTMLWAIFHSQYVGDTVRYLFSSFRTYPGWSKCAMGITKVNITCIPASEILYKCQEEYLKNDIINFEDTSAHHNYIQSFVQLERSITTTRFFVIAMVWVTNFFFSTVSDSNLLKIFKLAFICRTISTFIILIFLNLSARRSSIVKAFYDIFAVGSDNFMITAATQVAYMNGIGFLGLHDFSSMSVYTMVDNAVIIYTVLFISTALIRSWVVRVLYLELRSCVKLDSSIGTHYLVYAIMPLSTEFFHANKLYIFYLYFNVMLSTTAYLIMLTLTMAKLLHSKFNSVKNIYLVGIICCIGFGIALIMTTRSPNESKLKGLSTGVNVVIFYLGGFKTALIMWIYGVQRFATDIHYWLGFKPTKYWTLGWFCLPIMLSICLTRRIYLLIQVEDRNELMSAIAWITLSVLTVAFFQIKTIAKYLLQNNLVNLISASKRYGPPDPEDRKRRRNFDEIVQLRQCTHNCHHFDEMINCNHLPLMQTLSGNVLFDEESLTNIFEARPTRMRTSAVIHTA